MVLHITPCERRMLEQLARGTAPTEIALDRGMDVADLEFDLARLFTHLGVATTAEAVAEATRRGLVAA